MFNLRIVQANFGDCLIAEYGSEAAPRFFLVDGGPKDVFDDHLRDELQGIANVGGKLDLVAISHVDTDHIVGVLDLLATVRDQRTNGVAELMAIEELWHNSFSRAIDPDLEIQPRMQNLIAASGALAAPLSIAAISGIGEGNRVRQIAAQLSIPVNEGFPNDLICVDDTPNLRTLGNLTLRIVGPTRANLEELRRKWIEWLDRFGDDLASGNPLLMANADDSIPNLSSVMFLATADGRTVLFTGDGRSDHLLGGLKGSGLLPDGGSFHVDVLKVMHHGSDRNATRKFFKTVTADIYVISANGHPDNPDLATLSWIIETAQAQHRAIRVIFTNETSAVRKLPRAYPPTEFGYEMMVMSPNEHSMVIELGD